jgi:hypothetical protein
MHFTTAMAANQNQQLNPLPPNAAHPESQRGRPARQRYPEPALDSFRASNSFIRDW